MTAEPASLIWATRGRTWGFRFLRTGGLRDPLPVYESEFTLVGDESEIYFRSGRNVVLRIVDPEGRKDASGRDIPHEFIVPPPLADQIHSAQDGLRLVWDAVSAEYAEVWQLREGPASK